MDLMTAMYVVFGITISICLFIVVLAISGKSILFDFKRLIIKKGCDVYIANQTRKISHYYLVPKEGVFRIKEMPYVTNPEKVMNLTEDERKRVVDSLVQREQRINNKIQSIKDKKEILEQQANLLVDKKDEQTKYFIKSQIAKMNQEMKNLSNILRVKEENYFKERRPAFFYIEGDPVPKDFYEDYSLLDAKIIDNMVARSIANPPTKKTEDEIKKIKLIIIITGAAAAAAAILSFQCYSAIGKICTHLGAGC